MSTPLTSGLSVELLLRVININYGCFTLLCITYDLPAQPFLSQRERKDSAEIM